ncbi:MAG: PD-(D/E)XK nuclease family protein [Stackebrandtia sp.]
MAEFLIAYDVEIAECREIEPDESLWLRGPRVSTVRDIDRRRETGIEFVRAYMDEAAAGEWQIWTLPDGSPGIEAEFRVDLGGVAVKGFIDQILYWPKYQTVTVRDLKTGRSVATALQLGTYAQAVKLTWGAEVEWGDFWYARKAASGGMVNLARYSHEYLSALFGQLRDGIAAGVFLPNPSESCAITCGVRRACREMGRTTAFF